MCHAALFEGWTSKCKHVAMERVQPNKVEPLPPDKEELTQFRDRLTHDRTHDSTIGVTYERLHPSVPDIVLPATFLAVTLLGILFVLIILIIWLRAHLSCSSPKKQYDKSGRNPATECQLLRIMEPSSVSSQFKIVVDDVDENRKEEVDDFKFKLPSILNDTADFKYIDELDSMRNTSPTILKMNNNGGSSPKLPETDGGDDSKRSDTSGNSTPNATSRPRASEAKFVFPDESVNQPRSSRDSDSKFGKFKIALTEQQWIMHRKPPLDWRGYNINVPRAFSFCDSDLRKDTSVGEGSSRKYSATRSPSLEKDERSPCFFKNESPMDRLSDLADIRNSNSGNSSPVVEVRVQPLTTDVHNVFDKNAGTVKTKSLELHHQQSCEAKSVSEKLTAVRKFGSLNTGLRICTKSESTNPSACTEKIEMQNSPRLAEKENNPSPRFNFSPSFFASPDMKSPKFFGGSESKSPKYFAENQSRNASPKVLGAEKPPSPRFVYSEPYKTTQSPLIIDHGNGNYFSFDKNESSLHCNENKSIGDNNNKFDNLFESKESNARVDSIESSASSEKTDSEKDQQSEESSEDICSNELIYNLDANVNINIISSLVGDADESGDEDVTQIADKTDTEDLANSPVQTVTSEDIQDNLTVTHPGGSSANYRRQRLKSISLDSDNAKFIEQNLGISMVKHLRQENIYDSCEVEKISSPDREHEYVEKFTSKDQVTYFSFNNNEHQSYSSCVSSDDTLDDYKGTAVDETASLTDVVDSATNYFTENTPIIAFNEMQPRFSPKEFDTADDGATKGNKNKRNLTIDINKRDAELEKELSGYECLESGEKRMTPKTPTLKIKATSLDSSETLNLSLPQTNTLQVPQNSISVPNTPKRQLKRALTQKGGKLKASHYVSGNYASNLNEIVPRICQENQQGRKIYMNVKCPSSFIDSGIFLRENHANLMLFQASKFPMSRNINTNATNFNRRMGSFDENMVDYANKQQLAPQSSENRLTLLQKPCDSNMLGSNLLNFKQNLSVSSTNLKTLPEGVPSNDFDIEPEGKLSKKTLLQRRGSNQSLTINLETAGSSLKYSTLSLQGSNLSLASFGASNHSLANIKNSASNFSLNTDNRQKKNILERRNSNTSLTLNLDCTPQHGRMYSSSHCNLQGSHYNLINHENQSTGATKKCLLQRRGSNTSLTLNLQSSGSNLNRCTSNSSLNIHSETKVGEKKGLLERRSSNTSLTLNISGSNAQFDNNRVLSVSNYNLEGSGLSRYNSNQSIDNQKKGLLERRSSNTSLTLNINPTNYQVQGSDVPRDLEIDESVLQSNMKNFNEGDAHHKEKHRKSLSTENLFSKSYRSKMFQCKNVDSVYSFGSHDNLWSNCRPSDSLDNIETGVQNLTYICGDQENEIIYAFGDRQHIENAGFPAGGPIKNITTKPLSPHSTSADFKLYLANIQHLQNASNVLSRQQLKDLNSVFQDGYSKTECPLMAKRAVENTEIDNINAQMRSLTIDKSSCSSDCNEGEHNPQRLLPEPVLPFSEYQKSLLRNLHQEFWDLPTNFQEKPMVFGSHPKNRYKTILPNEHSRVILRAEPGESDEGYINANYIKGYESAKNSYIATQGPLQNTIYDFWLMVYQNGCQFHKDGCTKTNEERHFGSPQARTKIQQEYTPRKFKDNKEISIQKIIMLTNILENGRQKCEKYFPMELNEEMVFKRVSNSSYSSSCGGGVFFSDIEPEPIVEIENLEDVNTFRVKNVGIINRTGYTIRKLFVEYRNKYLKDNAEENINSDRFKVSVTAPDDKNGKDMKTDHLMVYHYWFDNWADHKCPKDVTALLDLSLDVLQNRLIDFGDKPRSKIDSDLENSSRERRLSAFHTAKAFFDEVSRQQDEHVRGKVRKNSLASKLDLPKPKHDLHRRESTGAIDSCKIVTSKSLFMESKNEEARKRSADRGKPDVLVEMPPMIVHCSAGIGRTGCLIAVLNGIKQMKVDEKVDILGIVCNMRLNRGGMVQNSEQYELIHKVLCLYEDLGLPDVD